MPLANCPRCGRLFNKMRTPICRDCEPDEEADFEKIRQSLADQPDQSAEEVAKNAGVTPECVLRLLDEGRIANVALSQSVKCGRCGEPAISFSKRLCQACLNKLSMELAAEQAKIVLPPRRGLTTNERTVRDAVDEKRKT